MVVSADYCRIITEHLDRITCVPYLTYLAERDRLLMLLSGGDPSQPMVMSSDDHGETWSDPGENGVYAPRDIGVAQWQV